MKQKIFFSIIFTLFLTPCPAQVKLPPVKITGKVVAYTKSNLFFPAGASIPNGNILIVKVKNSKKQEFIRILTKNFDEKSSLPPKIFSRTGNWKFTAARRADCDWVLNPDYPEMFKSAIAAITEEVWIIDEAPAINFIRPEEARNIPADKVLPCYLILSVRKK